MAEAANWMDEQRAHWERLLDVVDEYLKEDDAMNTPPIVSPQEWDTAREEMLVKEKEHTRARDALAAERRRMPWMAVEKDYEFEGPDGKAGLADLFDGRRQLVVYRFFFDPGDGQLPRARLPRLLLRRRPGVAPRAPERTRHHPRVRVPGPAGGDPAAEVRDGLGDALVHDHGRLRRRLRRGRMARHERVHPRRRRQDLTARTSSTAAETSSSAPPGPISTSRRSGARRSGRTRRRATRRPRRTSGGTTTTPTGTRHDCPRVRVSARGAAAGDHRRYRAAARARRAG